MGWRFIPTNRNSKDGSETLFEISHYLTEIVIKPGSPLVGELLKDNEIFSSENVDVVGMAQKNGFARPIPLQYRFAEEDVLLVQSDPSHMQSIVEENGLELLTTASGNFIKPESENEIMLEGANSSHKCN